MSGTSRYQAQYQNYRVRSGAELERAQRRAQQDRFYASGDDDSRRGSGAVQGLAVLVGALGLFIACAVDSDVGMAILDLLTFVR